MKGRPKQDRRAFALLVFLLAVPAGFAALTETEKADLAAEAQRLFREANKVVATDPEAAQELYRRSVMRFERLVREGGVENGKLYYNIGNVYFRMKDIGRAILNYRRAEPYMPGDANLRQNLSYARRRRVDAIEEDQRTRVLKTLFFWHYDVPGRLRMQLLAGAWVVFWAILAVRLFARRPSLTVAAVLAGVLGLLLAGSVTADRLHRRAVRPGVILEEEVTARKGDGLSYEPSFKEPLHAGTEFVLVEDRQDWYRIELADGRQCWVPSAATGMVR